jgi:hypothetical protein
MPGTHLYRVTYRIGANGPDSFEVTRQVRTDVSAIHDIVTQLGRKWEGQPIRKIEVIEPVEEV